MTTHQNWNDPNAKVIAEFRANQGNVPSRSGQTILLLNTTGAKSGLPRTNPLAYLPGDGCVYVFASKGGAPSHPDWYRNLVANPDVTVEIGADKYEATAEALTGPERDEIFAKQVALRPNFGDYQRNTSRVIPVVRLRRK